MSNLAFHRFDGIYLSKQENDFVHLVRDELETYQQKSSRTSVLLFPPLPSRLRYLIHKSIENLPDVITFSVGESWCRRLVVCHSDLRGDVQEDSDSEGNISLSEETARSREEVEGCAAKPKSSIPSRSKGPRRPDQALYMPRAARQRLHSEKPQVPSGDQELPRQACSDSRSDNELTHSCSSLERSTTDFKQESPPRSQDGALRVLDDPVFSPPKDEPDLTSRQNEAEPSVWENTISCFSEMRLAEDTREGEDPACECVDSATEDPSIGVDDANEEATLSQMIKAHLKEAVTISIEHVHKDYSLYENVSINADDFRHVIEIYDFPPIFKTDDLLDAFTEYSNGGMKIKWVDNTHALGVFSSEPAALHALSICHPLLKTRALADGSKKAKGKAIRRAEFIQPVKERPRTDCAVAKRMVTRALGLQGRGRTQQY